MYDKDIHERIYTFVINVLKLTKDLVKSPQNIILIKQMTRSATSMGANDQEADGTSTINDFTHCYTLVRKEGKETVYWLRLLADTNINLQPKIDLLRQEGTELVKIVSTIIYNTKRRKTSD